ncbi:MAG: malate synthase A [Microscillaceae bacterium]|nr:malate synthase A [Microscillaceae bacterium]MDW8461968.1 malate synthase A [Cytophagales bacterium]
MEAVISQAIHNKVQINAPMPPAYQAILSPEAVQFLEKLHQKFNAKRLRLLQKRKERQQEINQGFLPHFLEKTRAIRETDWQTAPVPAELHNRRVEITGPVDRKMIINALNSGANVFMADFEDANSPTWDNCLQGQINLYDAIRRQIDFTAENGKTYKLNKKVAILMVRPRGWHLVEKHFLVNNEPISASLFDFGLYFFHNAHQLLQNGSAPYFYLPKLEGHQEARLWNEVFEFAQQELHIPNGTIKATVLIETILAAFEMEEIIYELREHIAGLNAGRWDYIFSAIKKFIQFPDRVFPDRSQVTMQVPFMRAYTQLLVKTCHKRNVHAIGGMAAFIPNRKDAQVTEQALQKVHADKQLEATNGFDGTWVAHPDLVPIALEAFNAVLGEKDNQKGYYKKDLEISQNDLLNFHIPEGKITEQGLRLNINVGILYIESWLMGNGAAALYNLMEDAATAEISRAQVWQWLKHQARLENGTAIDKALVQSLIEEEITKIERYVGKERFTQGRFAEAKQIFEHLVFSPDFPEFLTLEAYNYID